MLAGVVGVGVGEGAEVGVDGAAAPRAHGGGHTEAASVGGVRMVPTVAVVDVAAADAVVNAAAAA